MEREGEEDGPSRVFHFGVMERSEHRLVWRWALNVEGKVHSMAGRNRPSDVSAGIKIVLNVPRWLLDSTIPTSYPSSDCPSHWLPVPDWSRAPTDTFHTGRQGYCIKML